MTQQGTHYVFPPGLCAVGDNKSNHLQFTYKRHGRLGVILKIHKMKSRNFVPVIIFLHLVTCRRQSRYLFQGSTDRLAHRTTKS